MTRHVATAAGKLSMATSARTPDRGYAASRQAYDRRRRQLIDPLVASSIRAYRRILMLDPCSYCMGRCGQPAADHIVPLDGGGINEPGNLTAAGRPCNAAKRSKPLLLFLAERRPRG